jgi:hypothetical protein
MKSVLVIACAAVLAGCGSSEKSLETQGAAPGDDQLRAYEADFRPSDFDAEIRGLLTADKAAPSSPIQNEGQGARAEPLEVVPGFRVQVFSSSNIDQAKARRKEIEMRFPEVPFYLEYDAPSYKVRGGNFLTRFDADRFLKEITAEGYRDAWIVPERVFRNQAPSSSPLREGESAEQKSSPLAK